MATWRVRGRPGGAEGALWAARRSRGPPLPAACALYRLRRTPPVCVWGCRAPWQAPRGADGLGPPHAACAPLCIGRAPTPVRAAAAAHHLVGLPIYGLPHVTVGAIPQRLHHLVPVGYAPGSGFRGITDQGCGLASSRQVHAVGGWAYMRRGRDLPVHGACRGRPSRTPATGRCSPWIQRIVGASMSVCRANAPRPVSWRLDRQVAA